MKQLLAFAFVLLVAPAALAQSAEDCPVLPPDSGLEWTYYAGPDFGVCYAAPPGSETCDFGIYLGYQPSFRPDDGTSVGAGVIAGRGVTWYPRDTSDDDSPFARQTLVVLDEETGYLAHVWVTARTEQELNDRLSVLAHVVFKP